MSEEDPGTVVRSAAGVALRGVPAARPRTASLCAVEESGRFKAALSELELRLLDARPGDEGAIQEALESLTRMVGVDRCGLAQFTNEGRSLIWTNGYAVPGTPAWPTLDLAALFPWYTEQVRQGRSLVLPRLPGGLPREAVGEAEFIAASGLKSHLTLPLKAGGEVLGSLGLGTFRVARNWTPELVSSLELLAGIFAGGLLQRRSAAGQRAAEGLSRSVLAAVPDPLLVLDAEGRVAQANGAWSRAALCADCPDAVPPGHSYLEALKRAPAARARAAGALPAGVLAVLGRTCEGFETVFRCTRTSVECQCRVAVTPLEGGGAVVLRADVSAIEQARAELERSRQEVRDLQDRLDAETVAVRSVRSRVQGFDEIVGQSAAVAKTLRQIEQVSAADSPVLILGETGTGKDLVARAVHARSRRQGGPLLAVNCAALPDALIESELFGYEKGAFTGAVARTLGRFEAADGGSLLLDEIGDMPLSVQAKLLRVLERGTFERLGSSKTIKVDVRVMAATHRDLEKEVREGRFRADLFYRLNVFPILVPPLRDRCEDVPLLVWHFINARQGALGRRIERVPDRLMRALETHAWPGNVRELENLVERALIVTDGSTLSLDAPLLPSCVGQAAGGTLDDVQRAHIEAVLQQCGWKIAGKGNAADRLGLKRGTLQFRMKKLGIRRPEQPAG